MKSHLHRELAEWADNLPEFTDDPVDRLAHSVAAFNDTPDETWAIRATNNVFPDHEWTGLTWGDLRALLTQLVAGPTTRKDNEKP